MASKLIDSMSRNMLETRYRSLRTRLNRMQGVKTNTRSYYSGEDYAYGTAWNKTENLLNELNTHEFPTMTRLNKAGMDTETLRMMVKEMDYITQLPSYTIKGMKEAEKSRVKYYKSINSKIPYRLIASKRFYQLQKSQAYKRLASKFPSKDIITEYAKYIDTNDNTYIENVINQFLDQLNDFEEPEFKEFKKYFKNAMNVDDYMKMDKKKRRNLLKHPGLE